MDCYTNLSLIYIIHRLISGRAAEIILVPAHLMGQFMGFSPIVLQGDQSLILELLGEIDYNSLRRNFGQLLYCVEMGTLVKTPLLITPVPDGAVPLFAPV